MYHIGGGTKERVRDMEKLATRQDWIQYCFMISLKSNNEYHSFRVKASILSVWLSDCPIAKGNLLQP